MVWTKKETLRKSNINLPKILSFRKTFFLNLMDSQVPCLGLKLTDKLNYECPHEITSQPESNQINRRFRVNHQLTFRETL